MTSTSTEGAGNTAPVGVALLDDAAITTEIAKSGWLYVWRSTFLDTGVSWLSVYRSVHITDDRPMFQPALELIGDAELLHRESVRDEQMMGYQAELSIYGVAEDDSQVTA